MYVGGKILFFCFLASGAIIFDHDQQEVHTSNKEIITGDWNNSVMLKSKYSILKIVFTKIGQLGVWKNSKPTLI